MDSTEPLPGDHDDQRTTTILRLGEFEHDLDQDLGPRAIYSTSFEGLQLVIKLQSMSKAARNDPRPELSLNELYRKYELESGDDGLDSHGDERPTALEASKEDPDDHSGCFNKQASVSMDQAAVSIYHEQEKSQKRPMSSEGRSLRSNKVIKMELDSTTVERSRDPDEASISSCFQDEADEEQSDENSFDEDRSSNCPSEYDSDFEFKWLEGIDVKITSVVDQDEHGKPEVVGYCEAKLIRRGDIRYDFYAELEQSTEQMCWLAFDLFDRYGRLRSEYTTHPVIKGSGIWNKELDLGDILLIERIYVKQARRRQQLGRKMIEALLQVVRCKTRSCIAFSFPSLLNLHDISQEFSMLKDDVARNEMHDRELDRTTAFFRSLGFRRVGNSKWFATTTDDEHPSHKFASIEDIDPPKPGVSSLHPILRPFQEITDPPPWSIEQLFSAQVPEDPDFVGALQKCVQQEGSTASCWMGTDKYGNNLLHLAVKIVSPACLDWILKQDFGPRLLESRNHRGETPMECLMFYLEELRVKRTINSLTASISDKFKGHSKDGVHCLVLLQGFPDPDSFANTRGFHALQQLIGGCTCEKCIEGVLSPRMSHALLTQAGTGYDMLCENLDNDSGSEWVQWHSEYLNFLPAKLRGNLATNKSVRTGFANLLKHIASCLEHNRLPHERNVLEELRKDNEWPPATRNYLKKGGTVENAFLAVCERAMEQDEWIGDGEYVEGFRTDIAKLPECRNDREFGFVCGSCGYRPLSLVHRLDMMGNTLDEYGNRIDSLK